MKQTWEQLLFAHWPLSPSVLRPWIPAGLTLDTWEGDAWLAVTPFQLTRLRARGLPPIPGTSAFPETNVRTYVTHEGRPGVWFFSLDAGSHLAVAGARLLYRLPYFHARFSIDRRAERVRYALQRTAGPPADLAVEYEPRGPEMALSDDGLPRWLTERYSLYTAHRSRVYRADIEHRPWPLQPARVSIRRNAMAEFLGAALPVAPALAHFSATLDVTIGPLMRVGRSSYKPVS